MPITNIETDLDARTMTVVAEFDASIRRVWQLYADPRQLERTWGPPEWPATFVEHDLRPGGRVHYVMTGPDGATSAGYWDVLEVDEPRGFAVDDGFADEAGDRNTDMPTTHIAWEFVENSGGTTTMTVTSTFASVEAMTQLLGMGMKEGMEAAMGQIDGVLAETA